MEGEWKGNEYKYTNQKYSKPMLPPTIDGGGDGFGRGVIVLVPSRCSVMQGTVPGYIGVDWSEWAKSTTTLAKACTKYKVQDQTSPHSPGFPVVSGQ